MKSNKTRLSGLACLDETPEQIQAEKREVLRLELERLRNDNQHGWLYRLAAKRREALDEMGEDKDGNKTEGFSTFVTIVRIAFCLVQCGLILSYVLSGYKVIFAGMFVALGVIGSVAQANVGNGMKDIPNYLLRFLILPAMPFVRIFDFVVLMLPNHRFDDSAKEQEIRGLEADLAEFSPSKIVPEYYNAGILAIWKELLGSDSELRKAERALTDRLERLRSNKERLRVRLQRAEPDSERASVLSVAMKDVEKREARFTEALAVVQKTVAKTKAILEECKESVARLCEPLEDAELLREIQADEAVEAKALQLAQTALTRHVSLVRERIVQLAGVVSAPVRLLPSGDQTQDMESLFTHIESVAEKVAALECFKPA